MKRDWQPITIIAGWEFSRFFKLKDQLFSLLLMVVFGGLGYGAVSLIEAGGNEGETVAVLHAERLQFTPPAESPVRINLHKPHAESALRELIAERKLDGLVIIHSRDDIEFIVGRSGEWETHMQALLAQARLRAASADAGLTPETLATVTAPPAVRTTAPAGEGATRGETILACVLIALMLFGVFHALSLFLIGVTSEKQQRVTEQILAAVGPQHWIDGKLLGITAATVAQVSVFAVAGVLFLVVWNAFGSVPLPVPAPVFDPWLVVLFFVLVLLGLLFWNCFMITIAALVDDPNTSARAGIMFLPILPVALAFFVVGYPDSPALLVLSWVPGLSSALLPARLVLAEVAWWEAPLAIALLLLGIAALRWLAGRVLAFTILMHGKEPSWSEVWAALRASGRVGAQ